MQGVFLDRSSLDLGDLDFTRLQAALPQWQMYPQTGAEALAEHLAGASVVVSNKVVLDAATLQRACLRHRLGGTARLLPHYGTLQ